MFIDSALLVEIINLNVRFKGAEVAGFKIKSFVVFVQLTSGCFHTNSCFCMSRRKKMFIFFYNIQQKIYNYFNRLATENFLCR